MTDVVLERVLDHPPAKVFTFITDPDLVLKWWGPEYVIARRGALDFSKPGPWLAEMDITDGRTVTVSGEILESHPIDRLSYTWAWHTDGVRGYESTVHFTLTAQGNGTLLRLTHSGLPDEDTRKGHTAGWTSTLINLTNFSKTQPKES